MGNACVPADVQKEDGQRLQYSITDEPVTASSTLVSEAQNMLQAQQAVPDDHGADVEVSTIDPLFDVMTRHKALFVDQRDLDASSELY